MKTVLYEKHVALGAKMVDFAGWQMPVQYTGIIDEHKTVRSSAGLFDVSHMGEFFVSGHDALLFLQKVVPQNISDLEISSAVYCQLPDKNGGIIDDLIIYRLEDNKYLIVVNASRVDEDWKWLNSEKNGFDVILENHSDEYSLLAVQGPESVNIMKKLGFLNHPEYFHIAPAVVSGIDVLGARTGYTGEDGFELLVKNEYAQKLWDDILESGKEYGLKPIGLGARDTLRLEAALPLYGNDLSLDTTPIEAGLGWSIPKDKETKYNGKEKIFDQCLNGTDKKLIGFVMTERAIARHEYEIFYNGEKVGFVTSGGYSPTLDKNIGLGYVRTAANISCGSEIQISVRNKLYKAQVVKRPFVPKKNKKIK